VPSPIDFYSQSQDREALNNPEKWFVRNRWLKHARRRLDKVSKGFVKFFTLPGVEGFDVRLFKLYGLLKTTATGFDPESLAYCEEIAERYTRIGNLLANARRFNGSYESLVGVGISGFTARADQWFPFDVINLDFSGPGFNQPGRNTSRTAEALLKTFKLQKSKRSSFSLFITIPANPVWNDESGKRQLEQCLRTNLTDNQTREFTRAFNDRYPKVQQDPSPAYRAMPYHEFLLITVPKLVIKYGLDEWFVVVCEEKLTYIGEGHTTKMVSFCFECEYVGLPDGYGGQPQTLQLHQYSENVANILRTPNTDINRVLASHPKLRRKYVSIRDEARKCYGTKL
jgi:hypothetical protein